MAIMQVVVNFGGQIYSPVHCHEHMVAQKANNAVNSTNEIVDNSALKLIRPTFLEVDCHYEQIDVFSLGFDEFKYIIAFIFLLGPLRLFLKIKEGKTSIEKLVEDYEDDRGIVDDIIARNRAQN